MARQSLLWPSVVAMVAADFTEEEVFTAAGVDSTEAEDSMEAGSGAEDFTEEAVSTVEVGFVADRDSMAATGFVGERAFEEERSTADSGEGFVGTASGMVSADTVGAGVDAVGVGVDGEIGMIGAGVGA